LGISGRGTGTNEEAQVKCFRLGTIAAVAASMLVPAIAQAADTPSSLYDCQPRDQEAAKPPPQPDLPPKLDAVLAEAIASDDFKQVCPAGEVPEPTRTNPSPKTLLPAEDGATGARLSRVRGGRTHGTRKSASKSRVAIGSFWYSWAYGNQELPASKGVTGLWAAQTNEQPYIDYSESVAGAHSIGQLWGSNEVGGAGCNSTSEIGWSESAGQFGDVNPHLFIFGFDCGVSLGYAYVGSGNWVQSSSVVFPNSTLTHNDVFHIYGTHLAGNNWWFYYDGQWVGYIPQGAWKNHFPWVVKRLTAGGEVATPNYSTCTDMGYGGLFGSHPWAAMFREVWYEYENNTKTGNANLYGASSDPSSYSTGNWVGGYQFRYGGPGWC
jgi:hypothetical protein